jgi:hypothetical protein
MIFLLLYLVDGTIRIRNNNYGSGRAEKHTYRYGSHNTGKKEGSWIQKKTRTLLDNAQYIFEGDRKKRLGEA